MTLGQKIRSRRRELGLSVEEVASRLGINRATVYRYESDEVENFPVDIIPPLANVLELSPLDLVDWGSDVSDRRHEFKFSSNDKKDYIRKIVSSLEKDDVDHYILKEVYQYVLYLLSRNQNDIPDDWE